jgi:hypothetical protein
MKKLEKLLIKKKFVKPNGILDNSYATPAKRESPVML